MNTESPRLRALLAAGAALVVFGITIPATAQSGGHGGQPGVGQVGSADEKANPKGQTGTDKNRGFTCDQNKGAGLAGNPALPHNCGTGTPGGGDLPPAGGGEQWYGDQT